MNSFVRFRRLWGSAGAVLPAEAYGVGPWIAAAGARLASAGGGFPLKRRLGSLASRNTSLGFASTFVPTRLEGHCVCESVSRGVEPAAAPARRSARAAPHRGAASTGMIAYEFRTLGRWNSDCFRLYVGAGPTKTSSIGGKMLSVPANRSNVLLLDGTPTPGDACCPSP